MLRTPSVDINRYRRSISTTHHRSAFDACLMSVTTGASRWGMPSYTDSSSIFGSIMIIRTSELDALYSRLRIIALMATDLPDPVVPATRR